MPSPPEQQGPQHPPTDPVPALAACQSAVPHCRHGRGLRSPVLIYVTPQWRRAACSSGFLWLTLPGRAGLTAHGEKKAVCAIPQAAMDMARLESVKWKKVKNNWKLQSSWSTNGHSSAGSHFTRQGGRRCASYASLGQNSLWSPHESPPAHTSLTALKPVIVMPDL